VFSAGNNHQVRYKVVATPTFGGLNGHMEILSTRVLNNNGVGWTDTPDPDPFAPDGCSDGDCIVAHAFSWQNGEITELGALTAWAP
jgi:hypothetical protein